MTVHKDMFFWRFQDNKILKEYQWFEELSIVA